MTDRLVETADGRVLHTMSLGAGDDLVVLEAGLGISGRYWGPVQQQVARSARVVAYERAGYGTSTPGPARHRDLAGLTDDLQAAIESEAHRRLVLVGHSWGGPIVRTLAARLAVAGSPPAGLVLVDQSDEHAADLYVSPMMRWSSASQAKLMPPLARMRLLAPLMRSTLTGLPEPWRTAAADASATVAAARAAAAELSHVADGVQQLMEASPDLSGVPVTVLSGARSTFADRRMRARLVAAHRETARALDARFVVAERSGHLIPVAEPELIATEAVAHFR
ncbi:alpha/beta hydrolase [Microbacterium sp. KUDC0406]|uniref:alpha/beta fold hydrolase n=1 Tax=Microbacterium sp. KUDC0406 TaxID=2909588 RepID=UPI001F491FF2|nr:alpha/beta hydrolase [Microbacterium sp. KUDC0406]UJP11528.1 alpha/beta hydrolase [Microbacterium sp. KUDC0406]